MGSFNRRRMAAFSVVVVAVTIAAPLAAVGQAPPPDVTARIDAAVQASRASQVAAGTGPGGEAAARHAQRRLESELSAIVVGTIAQRPDMLAGVVQAAVSAAPQARDRIADRAASAYPGYAAQIYAAAGIDPATAPAYPQARFGLTTFPGAPAYAPSAATPAVSASYARTSRASRDADVASRVVASIAANPARTETIVREAVARAPDQRENIVRTASRSFPTFAGRITAAAQSAPVTRPADAAPPTPAAAPRAQRPPAMSPVAAADSAARPPTASEPAAETAALVGPEETRDPIESFNRAIFAFNETVDFLLLRPVAWTYNKITPNPVIFAMRRFFDNLGSPVIFANDLLQLTFDDAAVTLGRFGINSTIGLLGFFDVADDFGLERHTADFGQTLHSYGTGPGPYIVLPLLGPSTARDGVGTVVDIFLDPLTYLLGSPESYIVTGSEVVVAREALLEPLDELKRTSVDYYISLRSAYYQRRAVDLNKGRGSGGGAAVDELFDAPEFDDEAAPN